MKARQISLRCIKNYAKLRNNLTQLNYGPENRDKFGIPSSAAQTIHKRNQIDEKAI